MQFTQTAIAALTLALTAGVASGGEVGVEAVAARPGPLGAAELERALARAVRGLGDEAVTDPAQLARERLATGVVRRERLAPFRQARELLAEGWRSYALVRTEEARERLLEARRRALEVADLAGGLRLLAEVSLRLGVIELELGNGEQAAREFRLAQRLAPQRAVTINQFKPQVVTAFRAAVAAPWDPREVVLRRRPAEVAVEIDGRVVPAAGPIELDAGLHLIVGRRPGRSASRDLVLVGDGTREIEVAPPVDPHAGPLFGDRFAPGQGAERASRLASAIALFAELDELLVVAAVWRGGQPTLVGQLCGGEPLRCGRIAEVRFVSPRGLAAAAAELLERLRTGPRRSALTLLADPRVASPEPRLIAGGGEARPWWKNPWLWAGVGAVAIAGGAAALFAGGDETGVVIETDPCQFGGC